MLQKSRKSNNPLKLNERFIYCFIFLFGFYINAKAQVTAGDLEPFYNSSYTPKELNVSSKDRVKAIYEYHLQESGYAGKVGSSEYQEFVYRSNYFLEKLNKSGEVFYGDTISSYLNALKDFILENNPKKDQITIYLTRHPSFNAFTNDFGSVYVNIASVSKLDSEQELLVLLAHEISHVLLRHTHQFEEYNKKLESNDMKSDVEDLLSQHKFNQ